MRAMNLNKNGAPTDRVWAIWCLHTSQFPTSITLDQRSEEDREPYVVLVGQDGREELCRLSETETSWLIARKAGGK